MTQIQALLSALNGLKQSIDDVHEAPQSYRVGWLDALDAVERLAKKMAEHEPPNHYTVSLIDHRSDGGGITLTIFPVKPQ